MVYKQFLPPIHTIYRATYFYEHNGGGAVFSNQASEVSIERNSSGFYWQHSWLLWSILLC